MIAVVKSAGRLRLVAGVILVVAVLLCAIFMPMAMTALAGCVAVIGIATLARRAPAPVRARAPHIVERASAPMFVMATGPPVLAPLRT